MRKVEEIRADVRAYIAMERASDYSKASLKDLWEFAIRLRVWPEMRASKSGLEK